MHRVSIDDARMNSFSTISPRESLENADFLSRRQFIARFDVCAICERRRAAGAAYKNNINNFVRHSHFERNIIIDPNASKHLSRAKTRADPILTNYRFKLDSKFSSIITRAFFSSFLISPSPFFLCLKIKYILNKHDPYISSRQKTRCLFEPLSSPLYIYIYTLYLVPLRAYTDRMQTPILILICETTENFMVGQNRGRPHVCFSFERLRMQIRVYNGAWLTAISFIQGNQAIYNTHQLSSQRNIENTCRTRYGKKNNKLQNNNHDIHAEALEKSFLTYICGNPLLLRTSLKISTAHRHIRRDFCISEYNSVSQSTS